MMTLRQAVPSPVGYTHASSVIPVVRLRSAVLPTVTRSLTPLKLRAFPKRPWVVQAAPEMAPVCPLPEASAALVPAPSLKLLGGDEAGSDASVVAATAGLEAGDVLPAPSSRPRCTDRSSTGCRPVSENVVPGTVTTATPSRNTV